MKRKSLPPHWYKLYIAECPVCGHGENSRERQYTPSPPKFAPERVEYDGMAYDYCLEWG